MALEEFLKSIGRAKTGISSSLSISPVAKVASKFTLDLIDKMKDGLVSRNATGSLSASLIPKIDIDGSIVEVEILAEDYWDFINSGVDGTQNNFGSPYSFSSIAKTQSSGLTFQQSLKLWFASKGIIAKDGDFDSLAFVMMQSIKRKGIKPSHFVDNALTEEAINQFQDDIFEAFNSLI